jgi:hypothetical protein
MDSKIDQEADLIALKLTDKKKIKLLKQALRDETFNKQKVVERVTELQSKINSLQKEIT